MGVWSNAYFLSTREFAPDNSFAGDGAYALERAKMLDGDPSARMVKFLLTPGTTPSLTGDGLLPGDIDGTRRPPAKSPEQLVARASRFPPAVRLCLKSDRRVYQSRGRSLVASSTAKHVLEAHGSRKRRVA